MTRVKHIKENAICRNCAQGIAEETLDGYYYCQNSQSDHFGHLLYGLHGCKNDFKFRPHGSYQLPKITTQSPS